MSVIHYGIANKILKWTNGVYGDIEDTQIKSVSLNITGNDIAFGSEYPVVLCPLPEGSMLMDASLNITTPFSDTYLGAKLSLGIGTDESDIDTPDNYDYKSLIFNNQNLNTPGIFTPQGYLQEVNSQSMNKNINTLVAYFNVMGVWSVGGNAISGRYNLDGCGTQNAGLAFGGWEGYSSDNTEEYDGTSWSTGGNLGTPRAGISGCGTQTAAISCAGWTTTYVNTTEKYNGTAWSAGNALSITRRDTGACGTQTAALCTGGYNGSTFYADTEEYDGISWSTGVDLNTERSGQITLGTITSALVASGQTTGSVNIKSSEEYNGTTWSITNDISVEKSGSSGAGSQSNGLIFGGNDGGYILTTEEYNGTNWSIGNNTLELRGYAAGFGTQTAGVCTAGWDGSYITTTEEYSPGNLASLVSAWFLGGDLNLSDDYSTGCGTQDAALKITGINGGRYCEYYNGTSWTTTADLTPLRAYHAACGSLSATVTFAGYWSSNINNTDEFNGSSWSTSGSILVAKRMNGGCGTQTAGLSIGGYTSTFITNCEEYNGATWSAGGNLAVANRTMGGAGTQTSALCIGGDRAGNYSVVTEEYDGAAWTTGGSLNNGRDDNYATGESSSSAITTGGAITGNAFTSTTEEYNGTAWTVVNNSLKASRSGGTAGIQSKALIFAGSDGSTMATTQEYNIPSQGDLDLNITFSYI